MPPKIILAALWGSALTLAILSTIYQNSGAAVGIVGLCVPVSIYLVLKATE